MSYSDSKKTSKKTIALLVSYALALVAVLCGYIVEGYSTAAKYSTQLGLTYEQGLTELSEHLNNINNDLKKGMYCGTASGAMTLAMSMRDEAGAAKTCLSQVPTFGTELDNTYKFLSQVGEFSYSLAKKLDSGEKITAEESNQLVALSEYSEKINASIAELCVQMNNGGQWSNQIKSTIIENGSAEAANILNQGFEEVEENLTDFPTLLYDGPFSDHILQSTPLFIQGKDEVSAEQAAETAAEMTGTDAASLTRENDENGIIPCYQFSRDSTGISVTKGGGVCSYIMNSRAIDEPALGYEECLAKAKEFLDKLGLGDFKESYYTVNEGQCLINFAYTANGVVFYTDLVKIGVAMDNGEIVSYNAQGYIMNHYERTVTAPKYTLDEARKVLSPLLTVESEATAVVPLDTREEQLCYEFVCRGKDEDEIIVYVNANNLNEEKIMILLKTDGGTLTL